ncbi:MAG TPA: metal-dependent hydrolase [Chitinophagaceae bacterium]|nr:metal-dependent hydrolase [Chitinophagaceae bacterium]
MDTITHIVLGATIGEATAGKRLGKRALFLGAGAQSIPDLDFLSWLWLNKTENLLAHRGFTHSIFFAVLVTVLLSFFFKWYFRRREVLRRTFILLFGLNLFAHLLLDSFNAYGIGLLEPFHEARVSLHVLYVADPFFSIWTFLAFVFLLVTRLDHRRRRLVWQAALALSGFYLLYAFSNKWYVEGQLRRDMAANQIGYEEFFTTPTPLNSWLWFAVIKQRDGYYTTYRSVFDRTGSGYYYFPRNDSLITNVKNQQEVQDLLRFAQGYYTVESRNGAIAFNVLRFGQVVGWYNPRERFAFHYLLDKPEANHMLLQRGRFLKWDGNTFRAFVRRIAGR